MRHAETSAGDRQLAALFGLAALIAVALTGGNVAAQPSTPPSATQAPPGPTPPAGPTPPEKIAPSTQAMGNASQGVIRPPANVDPGIKSPGPAPTHDTMPVIPPPGTPGGDTSVQPK